MSKPRILGINGIRTDGSTSTDKLLKELSKCGHQTIDVNYPRVNVFTARSRSRQLKNARQLVNIAREGDILIAHSYGCLLALRAMEIGCRFSSVYLFAPAMNVDFTFPHHGMKYMEVIHNPSDKAIKMGQLLWWHDFGAMGRKGYQGPPDERIINVLDESGRSGKRNHSHYFHDVNIQYWANHIDQQVAEVTGAI